MYNYKSPIETTMLQVKSDIEKSLEDTTYKAVIECGVAVDKDELIKALAYDREQYRKGFVDGYRAAQDDLVCCRDCEYWRHDYGDVGLCVVDVPDIDGVERQADDFCRYAKRKDV